MGDFGKRNRKLPKVSNRNHRLFRVKIFAYEIVLHAVLSSIIHVVLKSYTKLETQCLFFCYNTVRSQCSDDASELIFLLCWKNVKENKEIFSLFTLVRYHISVLFSLQNDSFSWHLQVLTLYKQMGHAPMGQNVSSAQAATHQSFRKLQCRTYWCTFHFDHLKFFRLFVNSHANTLYEMQEPVNLCKCFTEILQN